MDFTRVIDYSALSSYLTCPRKFYFQYVAHLRSQRPNIDLVFGSCWHYGIEQAYKELITNPTMDIPTLIRVSNKAFQLLWSIEGAHHWPDPDIIFPKSPGNAPNLYERYWDRHHSELDRYTILAVETPFTINLQGLLGEGYPNYIGRLDLVLQAPDGSIKIVDHKTTKAVDKTAYSSYYASLQTDGYLTAGKLYFDKIPTIEYRIAIVQKTRPDMTSIPVMKRSMLLDRFLNELAHHTAAVKIDLTILSTETEKQNKDYIPRCFERRPGYACTMYFRECPYYDLCYSRCNPFTYETDTPQGYVVHEWDPTTHEEELNRKIKELKK